MKLAKRRFLVFAVYNAGWCHIWGWLPYGFGKRPNVRRRK